MITVDGVPQFEPKETSRNVLKLDAGLTMLEANQLLRDHYSGISCDSCKHCLINSIQAGKKQFWNDEQGRWKCNELNVVFPPSVELRSFHCSKFERAT